MFAFLGCKHTLLAHVQFCIHQNPQALLYRAALNELSPSLYSYLGLLQTSCSTLHFNFLNFMSFLWTLSSSSSRSLWIVSLPSVDSTAPFSFVFICNCAEGALGPTVCVTDKDIQEHQSPGQSPQGHQFPSGQSC